MLEEYDGDGILIATTNLEGSLDKALFRRFDDFIELPKPSETEIAGLLRLSFSALKLNRKINLKSYANKMIGMSHAIVEKIAIDASKKAIINSCKEITVEHFNSALNENKSMNK